MQHYAISFLLGVCLFFLTGCLGLSRVFLGFSDDIPPSMTPSLAEEVDVKEVLDRQGQFPEQRATRDHQDTALNLVAPSLIINPRSEELFVKFFVNTQYINNNVMQGPYHIMVRLRKSGWNHYASP